MVLVLISCFIFNIISSAFVIASKMIILHLANVFPAGMICDIHCYCFDSLMVLLCTSVWCVINPGCVWDYSLLNILAKFFKSFLLLENMKCNIHINNWVLIFFFFFFSIVFEDEYNLNPGLEWEDEFTGRSMFLLIAHSWLS
jgi:hypothetical protein